MTRLTKVQREELEAIHEVTTILGRPTFQWVGNGKANPTKALIERKLITWRRPIKAEVFSPSRFRMVQLTAAGRAALGVER